MSQQQVTIYFPNSEKTIEVDIGNYYAEKPRGERLHEAVRLVLIRQGDEALHGANLDAITAPLNNYGLRESYIFQYKTLRNVSFAGARLNGFNFVQSSLIDVNFTEAELKQVNFSGANLHRVEFRYANLANADFSEARLENVGFNDASMFGVTAAGCRNFIPLGNPNGWTMAAYLHEGYMMIRCGCQHKRLDEAKVYWSEEHECWESRKEIAAALVYAEAVAIGRGWPLTEEEARGLEAA